MKILLLGKESSLMAFFLIYLLNPHFAQVSLPIDPLSDAYKLKPMVSEYVLPAYNNDSLDHVHNQPSHFTSNTFGVSIPVDIDLCQYGQWDTLANGMLVWRLRIFSPTANGFKAIFDRFHLPKSGSLFFYRPDKSSIYGAFTAYNNKDHMKFGTASIFGKELIVEYNVSQEDVSHSSLHFNEIVHIFTNVDQLGDAAACQTDVNCTPWANEWCNEIRSVVKIEFREENAMEEGRWNYCSGVLVNNTNNNFDPYILTAKHCIHRLLIPPTPANTNPTAIVKPELWTIYYNFQTPQCGIVKGNDRMSTVGVEVLTFSEGSGCPDIGLLRVTSIIPLGYNIFFAGWNRSNRNNWPSDEITTIHHPKGDLKKITDAEIDKSQKDLPFYPNLVTCYEVNYNQTGIIEDGSSGAPSFLEDHRISSIQSQDFQTCDDRSTPAIHGALKSLHDLGFDWYNFLGGGETLDGIDPLNACQPNISIVGKMYPGNDWQQKNEITIQAGNTITAAPNNISTEIMKNSTYFPTNKSQYVFKAGTKISLLPGFKVERGAELTAEIAPCDDPQECGINYEPVPERLAQTSYVEKDELMFKIYPNPCSSFINIEAENDNEISTDIRILNSLGQELSHLKGAKLPIQIDLSGYPGGYYFLNLTSSNKISRTMIFNILN